MAVAGEARTLVSKVTNDDVVTVIYTGSSLCNNILLDVTFAAEFGSIFEVCLVQHFLEVVILRFIRRSIYGLGNGFYSLNLSVKSDRLYSICL